MGVEGQLLLRTPIKMIYNQTFSGEVDVGCWGDEEYSNCVFTSGTKLVGELQGTQFTNCTMLQVDFADCWGSPTFNNCTVLDPVQPGRYHDWHPTFNNTPSF